MTVEIRSGCWVYGSHGAFIGTVEGAGPTLLRVRGGRPFSPVYYVPLNAILGVLGEGREVVLDCRADELGRKGWLAPPEPDGRSSH